MNGVDDADLPARPMQPPADRFVLAHVGTVYDSFDPSAALRVLTRLVEQGEIERERVEVRFVGSIWRDDFEPPRGSRFEQTRLCRALPRRRRDVGGDRASSLQAELEPGSVGEAVRVPGVGQADPLPHTIRTISPRRLVRDWHAGVVADPDDEDEIEAAILTLWRRWRDSGLPDQPEVRRRVLERYSRQAGAKQLAQVLEDVARG